jgi:TPR repeat protein
MGSVEHRRDAAEAAAMHWPENFDVHEQLAAVYHDQHEYSKEVNALLSALPHALSSSTEEMQRRLGEARDLAAKQRRGEERNALYSRFPSEAMLNEEAARGNSVRDWTEENMLSLIKNGVIPREARGVLCARLALVHYLENGRTSDARAMLNKGAKDFENAECMYNLGRMYMEGRGVRKDLKEAFKLFEQASKCDVTELLSGSRVHAVGVAEACNAIGSMYDQGVHVRKHQASAAKYWQRGADLGCQSALNNIGRCFLNGSHGLPVDLPRACDYFKMAASSEAPASEAFTNLAHLYWHRCGDARAATWWLEGARSLGAPINEDALGRLHQKARRQSTPATGAAVPQSLIQGAPPSTPERYVKLSIDSLAGHHDSPFVQSLVQMRHGLDRLPEQAGQDPDFFLREFPRLLRRPNVELLLGEKDLVLFSLFATIGDMSDLFSVPEADKEIVKLHRRSNDPAASIPWLLRACEQHPREAALHYTLASLLMHSGETQDIAKARRHFVKALSVVPESDKEWRATLLYILGVSSFEDGDNEAGESFLRRFLELGRPMQHHKVPKALISLAGGDSRLVEDARVARRALAACLRVNDGLEVFDVLEQPPVVDNSVRGGAILGDSRHPLLKTADPMLSKHLRERLARTTQMPSMSRERGIGEPSCSTSIISINEVLAGR